MRSAPLRPVPTQEERSRGARAKQILEDEVFQLACRDAAARVFADWQRTELEEVEKREQLFAVWRGLQHGVLQSLRIIADRGMVSEQQPAPEGG